MLLNKKNLSLESIDFQSDLFHKELTIGVNKLRESGEYNNESVKAAAFSEVIKNHTAMTIVVVINDEVKFPCIELPKVDKNHPLVDTEMKTFRWRDGITAIDFLGRPLNGGVNRATGKVTGDFTKFVSTIYLPLSLMKDKLFTDGEISATILHEVGHLWSYFEYLGYTYKTNMVLAGLSRAFNEIPEASERKVILKAAEKNLGIEFNNIDKVADAKNSDAAQVIIISETTQKMRSELGENLYDNRAMEQLADEFAARHGAARDNATALGKVMRKYGDKAAVNTATYLTMEALKLTFFSLSIFGLAPLAVYLLIIAYPYGESYDEPKVRVGKLKNQLVSQLKDQSITNETRRALLEDIEVIKATEDDLELRRDFYRFVIETAIPSRRKMKQQIEIQIELEGLAANELFITASKFHVGASNA